MRARARPAGVSLAMRRRVTPHLLFLGLILTGCATGYQPVGFGGGYTDLQLGTDLFRVAFRGNGYTSAERAADFALLRAAEVTLAQGATHFLVLSHGKDAKELFATVPSGSGTLTPTGLGGYTYSPATTFLVPISKHRVEFVIQLLRDPPPPGVPAYSAALIRTQIRQKYNLAD